MYISRPPAASSPSGLSPSLLRQTRAPSTPSKLRSTVEEDVDEIQDSPRAAIKVHTEFLRPRALASKSGRRESSDVVNEDLEQLYEAKIELSQLRAWATPKPAIEKNTLASSPIENTTHSTSLSEVQFPDSNADADSDDSFSVSSTPRSQLSFNDNLGLLSLEDDAEPHLLSQSRTVSFEAEEDREGDEYGPKPDPPYFVRASAAIEDSEPDTTASTTPSATRSKSFAECTNAPSSRPIAAPDLSDFEADMDISESEAENLKEEEEEDVLGPLMVASGLSPRTPVRILWGGAKANRGMLDVAEKKGLRRTQSIGAVGSLVVRRRLAKDDI